MSIKRIIPIIIALTLLIAGCRSQKDAARTATAERDNTAVSSTTKKYYTAAFTCTAQGMKANGQVRMEPDSIVWLSVSKVIELGRARFTTDSVVVYAKVMGRCFRGTYDDVYKRFHYRTDFAEITKALMSDNAAQQLTTIANQFGLEATFTLEPWKRVEKLTFPLPIPSNVLPL